MRAFNGRGSTASTSALVSLGALALASLWPSAALAQVSGASTTAPEDREAPAEATGDSAAGTAIIVTGSRLARSTFDTPSPVTVLGAEEFDKLQITNVGEGVAELPAFRPSNNPSTNGFGSFNVGAQIVNLRGLGVTRNLVLVDGRRFAPTTREGSVDLNFVPSTLVSRVDVVTGGASAAYGSDAIAGVVNVILDTKLDGLKAQIDYGQSEEGDAENLHAGLGFGTGFAGDRGHFIIGGEYSDQQGAGNCFTRDWCRIGAVVSNPNFTSTNTAALGYGQPQFVRSDTNAGWYVTPSGVISRFNNAAGLGNTIANSRGTGAITFTPAGAILSAQQGTVGSGLSQVGGDLYPTYNDVDLIAPVERYTGFGHVDFDFSDNFHGFLEGSYGHVDGATYQAAYFSATIPIYGDNPYIPAGVRSQFPVGFNTQPTAPYVLFRPGSVGATTPAAVSGLTLNLGKVFDDLARGYSRSKADTYRATAGFSGDLGSNFSWDAYYQYGRTDRLQTVDNNLVVGDPANSPNNVATIANSNARFFFAADAVINPATGQPTCRALLSTDPAVRAAATGCVPINLFGAGNVTQQGKDYIYAQLREDIQLQQHVFAANLRGDSGRDILAGPLSFAVGGEYRVDKIDVVHDPLSNVYAYFQNFGSDYNGKTEVAEGYLEVELPLAKDLQGFQELTLNGAIREAFYKINGFGSYLRTAVSNDFQATTWKLSLNYQPVDWLRFRVTRSRDVRAPNFAELFLASASSFTPVTNPFVLTPAGGRTTNTPSIVTGGSPDLEPEKGDTTTVGFVVQPQTGPLSRLRVSVDAYHIKIKDFIGTAPGGAQSLVDKCFLGFSQTCAFFDRNAAGAITTIRNVNLNLDEISSRGVDFEADYRVPLGNSWNLNLHAIATHVYELKTVSLGDFVDRAGQTGNTAGLAAPDWIFNGSATLAANRWQMTLQGRYINSGFYDAQRVGPGNPLYATTAVNSISDNTVDSRFYVNLFGSFFVDSAKRFEVFGSVSNLFNTDPPAAPETQFWTNPVYFDTIGRFFRIGARAKI